MFGAKNLSGQTPSGFTRSLLTRYTIGMQIRLPKRNATTQARVSRWHRLPMIAERHAEIHSKAFENRALDPTRLRQAQKMEVVGQLASGLAHDFRHILSVVVGNLDLLMARHTADTNDRTAVRRAMDAANRGVALIQSVMGFIRERPLDPQIVDLNHVLSISMLDQITGSQINLVRQPAPYPTLVKVDQTQLELALLKCRMVVR
jgi:signal transduction histidine kinase